MFSRHKDPEAKEIMSFTDIANDLETDTYTRSSGLSFDPRDYRAKKEVNIEIRVYDSLLTYKLFNEYNLYTAFWARFS